jgi:diguanylate cyclase (GGDEF)-like protein
MTLDSRTLMLLMTVAGTTVGVLLVIAWLQRRSHRALAIWGGGSLLTALAAALIMTRGVTSFLVSVTLAYLVAMLAYGVMWTAARAFADRPARMPGIVAGPMAWLAFSALPGLAQATQWRIAFVSVLGAAYTLATARELWRGRGEPLLSRYPMVGLLLLHALCLTARSIAVCWEAPPSADQVLRTGWVALGLEPLVVMIASGFLLLSMAKERAEAVQQRAARTDELTGVANRRAFLEKGERRLADATLRGAPAALLLFDLDHFKRINDGYGHEVGDRVLKAFAQRATQMLRPGDLFGRIGGEEFAALLAPAGQEAALGVAERIRAAIERLDISASGLPVPVSVSTGVATGPAARAKLSELLCEADHALYNAKSAGRNCVRLGGPRAARPREAA